MLLPSGRAITPDTALTLSAVWRAVRLLSDDVAQLPLHMYRGLPERAGGAPGGKERVKSPLAEVLASKPNARQTSLEFRQMLTMHVLLRGNGYARIVSGARGYVDQLRPLAPERTRAVLTDAGRALYIHTPQSTGREERLTQDEVFHLRGCNTDADSAEGMSPITLARRSLTLTTATEEFGSRQFSQTPRHSFILSHPQRLDEEVSKRISATFRASGAGPSGWGNTPVLEEGMTATPVSMSHDDAQFLQTRAFQITDIARWFGVPPHMIGDLSRSSFSNIEQQSLDYLIHSLMPWLRLWEESIERDLVLDDAFPSFIVDGLLRGDSLTRAQSHQLYVNMRARTPNEVRALENMNPVPWGDEPAMTQGAPAPVAPSGEPFRPARSPQEPGANRLNGVAHA